MKKFNNLHEESRELHKEINSLVKTMLIEHEDELDNLDMEFMTYMLKASSITKKLLDLTDNCCKSLDNINDKLDKLDKKLDNK